MRPSAALVLASAILAGCGESSGGGESKPMPTANAKPKNALTGYGATTAAWNATHKADDRSNPGSAYDADPALGRGDVQHNDRYYGVVHMGGRVVQYQMRFSPGTTIREARREVMREFPSDARVTRFRTGDSCAILSIRSKTLARASVSQPAVEFVSGAAGDTYTPSDVWDAIVSFGISEC